MGIVLLTIFLSLIECVAVLLLDPLGDAGPGVIVVKMTFVDDCFDISVDVDACDDTDVDALVVVDRVVL